MIVIDEITFHDSSQYAIQYELEDPSVPDYYLVIRDGRGVNHEIRLHYRDVITTDTIKEIHRQASMFFKALSDMYKEDSNG